MMKERTMDALSRAEEYFVDVIEQEAHGDVVPSRTEELYQAVKGLKCITMCRYKKWLKHKHDTTGSVDTTTDSVVTMSYRS